MFTIEQIKAAHSKVKSGADFPRYIHDIEKLGVAGYVTHLNDGHTDFTGTDGATFASPPKYERLVIASRVDSKRFQEELKVHQEGGTSFLTFCSIAAGCGIEGWSVDVSKMTCSYFDPTGTTVLVEEIPKI